MIRAKQPTERVTIRLSNKQLRRIDLLLGHYDVFRCRSDVVRAALIEYLDRHLMKVVKGMERERRLEEALLASEKYLER